MSAKIPVLLVILLPLVGGCVDEDRQTKQCMRLLQEQVSAPYRLGDWSFRWLENPNAGMTLDEGLAQLEANPRLDSIIVMTGTLEDVIGPEDRETKRMNIMKKYVLREVIYDRRAFILFNAYDQYGLIKHANVKATCTISGDNIWADLAGN